MSEQPSTDTTVDGRTWKQDRHDLRRAAAWPFGAIGMVSIVTGGLVSALTRPLELDAGPWIAAYLVLVGGVAQLGLGAGQAGLAPQPPNARTVLVEVVAWNASTALTILGTLVGLPLLTTVGAASLLVAVGCLVRQVPLGSSRLRWAATAHWTLAGLVAMSAPIGVILAWIRHG